MRQESLDPAALGLAPATREDLRGGSAAENAEVFRSLVGGAPGPVREAVLLNAAGALVAFDGPPAHLATRSRRRWNGPPRPSTPARPSGC